MTDLLCTQVYCPFQSDSNHIFKKNQTHHGEQRTSEVSLKEIMHYLSA